MSFELLYRKALLNALKKKQRECEKDGEENGGEAVLLAEGIESAYETVKAFPATDTGKELECAIEALGAIEAGMRGIVESTYADGHMAMVTLRVCLGIIDKWKAARGEVMEDKA